MYTVFYSLGTHKNITGYNQQLLQHLKGYKAKVAVSTIYPVCFEALQSRKGNIECELMKMA